MGKIKQYRIVIGKNAIFNEKRAAQVLAENIRLVTGARLAIVTDAAAPTEYEIVVGKTERELTEPSLGGGFARSVRGTWEYVLISAQNRLYVTGLGVPGEPAPYTSAYRLIDDGGIGTVFAAKHFVEEILGYDLAWGTFDAFPETPDAEIPDGYRFLYTRERLKNELPADTSGPAVWSVPCAERLDWNMSCLIFKTRENRLVVIDGGFPEDAEHVVRVIEHIAWNGKDHGPRPVISAWLYTHLHVDHFGVLKTLCDDPALRARVEIRDFYHHLLPLEFYTTVSREHSNALTVAAHAALTGCAATLGARVHEVERGDVIAVDELQFEVLRVPAMADGADMNFNDSSVVYRLTYDGAQTWMLLADAEWVSCRDLMALPDEKLKSDVVQIGHHGCGNVSLECYRRIAPRACFWQIGNRFWYGDNAEGMNTHNTGVIRTRAYVRDCGILPANDYRNTNSVLRLPLPLPISE